jgi:hypothetical protein
MLFNSLFVSAAVLAVQASASLSARGTTASCSTGYTVCSPSGSTGDFTPSVDGELGLMFTEIVESLGSAAANKRDLKGQSEVSANLLGKRAQSSVDSVCCKS